MELATSSMRGAIVAWVAQAVAFALITGGLAGTAWFAIAVALAVVSLGTSAAMGQRATVCCVTMAAGSTVWNTVDGWPMSATLLMAGPFLVPLMWRSGRFAA